MSAKDMAGKSRKPSPYFPALVEHINQSWIKMKGFGYPFIGRDFRDLKKLCNIFNEWGVCAMWDVFMASDSPWVKKSGYSISAFCRCIPWITDDPNWKAEARKYEEKMAPYPQVVVDIVNKANLKVL